jgi:hypothetical protein
MLRCLLRGPRFESRTSFRLSSSINLYRHISLFRFVLLVSLKNKLHTRVMYTESVNELTTWGSVHIRMYEKKNCHMLQCIGLGPTLDMEAVCISEAFISVCTVS